MNTVNRYSGALAFNSRGVVVGGGFDTIDGAPCV